MLSPASRELLANTVIVKRREINDAHLSLHSHESEIRRALRTIGRLEAEVLSLMTDLERDDQAIADAGEDVPDARAKLDPIVDVLAMAAAPTTAQEG